MDDITTSKFGDVNWTSSNFMGHSVFYRPAFGAMLLFCKAANFWDIDLKFLEYISGVNIDNPAKFCIVSMPRNTFPNIVFQDFDCYLHTMPVVLKKLILCLLVDSNIW